MVPGDAFFKIQDTLLLKGPSVPVTYLFKQEDADGKALTFAVLEDRDGIDQLLRRIENKYFMKILEFMRSNPFLKALSRNALTKFALSGPGDGQGYGNFNLLKRKYVRNFAVYKEGGVSDQVFIVTKGEFQLQRILAKEPREGVSLVLDLLGGREQVSSVAKRNVLSVKLPEMKDVPRKMMLQTFCRGSFVGEDDVLYRHTYGGTLRCMTQKGTVYMIAKTPDEFHSWL